MSLVTSDGLAATTNNQSSHASQENALICVRWQRAAGLGSYIKPTKRKMETLMPAAVLNQETLEDVKKRAKLELIETEDDHSVDNEGDVKM